MLKCNICGEMATRSIGAEFYCDSCYKMRMPKCSVCGNSKTAFRLINNELVPICDECLKANYFSCMDCGSFHSNEIKILLGGRIICKNCRKNNYFVCSECGDVKHKRFGRCGLKSEILCSICFSHKYFICHTCHNVFENSQQHFNDEIDDHQCLKCFNGHLYEYNYSPPTVFYGKGEFFMGFELEMENVSYENENVRKQITKYKKMTDFVYAKRDGSLNRGFEIVSHPFTWEWLKQNRSLINDLTSAKHNGFRAYDTDTCGMHVHLSKNTMSSVHLMKFLKFFFENPDFVAVVSQRKLKYLKRWASLEDDPEQTIIYKAKTKNDALKYVAVSLRKTETVEIRIFRGTLNYGSIMKNLEFAHSIYEYTKACKVSEVSVKGYIKYLKEKSKQYPHINEFISKKWKLYKVNKRMEIADYLKNTNPIQLMASPRLLSNTESIIGRKGNPPSKKNAMAEIITKSDKRNHTLH